jgi:hypothetical protein
MAMLVYQRVIGDYPLVIWFIWSFNMSLYGFDGDF